MSDDDNDNVIPFGVSDKERKKQRAILDKTSGDDLRKKFAEDARADIEAGERNIFPPVVMEPRCHVCTSQWRQYIEYCIIKGYSDEYIANSVPPEEGKPKPSRKSVKGHYKEHMRIDQTVVRAELEEEADLLRQNVERGAKGALTNRGVLQVLVRKVYDDMLNNVVTAEPKDLIQTIKLLNEMETDTAVTKVEETEGMMRIFLKAIQTVCSPEQQGEIQAEVRRLREMDSIEYAMERELTPPKMIEVEVVHEGTSTQGDN